MLHVMLPKQPVPAALEEAVKSTRAARDVAEIGEARDQAEQNYEAACRAVRDFVSSVGEDQIPVPKEVEAEGPAAVESFLEAQKARLASEASEVAPKTRRRSREEA